MKCKANKNNGISCQRIAREGDFCTRHNLSHGKMKGKLVWITGEQRVLLKDILMSFGYHAYSVRALAKKVL